MALFNEKSTPLPKDVMITEIQYLENMETRVKN